MRFLKLGVKILLFIALILYGGLKTSLAQSGSVTLDHLNLYSNNLPDSLPAGVPLEFYMRFSYTGIGDNDKASIVDGVFKFYSPDGAIWQPIVGEWTNNANWNNYFDLIYNVNHYSADGTGEDTVHFAGLSLVNGLPSGFSGVGWVVTTKVDEQYIGQHFCFDSSRASDGTGWLWVDQVGFRPTWDGPHCFKIIENCCQGLRGDINGDGVNANILDLTYQVDYQFRGRPEPACRLEADFNADGYGPNVQDLADLVSFIFRGGPPGVACP